ncbi:hypothetical protein DK419_08805 [Methylobacterium terrae]|uniref:DUF6894 domain-containing protein n=1 Tax=Methylobacterium terrae TaxID=2202827 RepID=A0A2U8WJU3_9HYPH|nr:hypothetical protein [Methylobacterium terrae]AWN46403.1 hypothetical protein DK419_08805 [Methylobacterium terrae]
MPNYYLVFSDIHEAAPSDPIEFADLHHAYLAVCASIPGIAQELLIERKDPLAASCVIADDKGRNLMTVPFTDVLSPSEWRPTKARRRPHGWPRSARSRDDLALASFRRMFGPVDAGCVLMTPEMHIVEMNRFGARHSHVDPEAIRGRSIYGIFADLHGAPKANFTKFMSLAQAGAASQITDLPYLVLDAEGQTTNGWWNARTWPIFDDDENLLGFVEWAEPFTAPTRGGRTKVTVAQKSV